MTKAVKNGFPVAVLFKKQKPETHSTKVFWAFCITQQTKNSVSLINRELQSFEAGSLLSKIENFNFRYFTYAKVIIVKSLPFGIIIAFVVT